MVTVGKVVIHKQDPRSKQSLKITAHEKMQAESFLY